jgi:hypothetical protein
MISASIGVLAFSGSIDHNARGVGADDSSLRSMSNQAFGVGEKLTYAVKYKFITAGYAVMAVGPSTTTVSGRTCYDVRYTMRTTNSFDRIFKVRDSYRTWIDTQGIFPWKFQQIVREGGYSRNFSANIDQKDNVARTTEGSYDVPEFVQDVLSAFYYTRARDLSGMKTGASFTLNNFYKDKTHELRVIVLGRETVGVEAGTFRCVKVQPLVKEGGLFKSEGTITIWLTDDARKMPVKVATKVAIGSIDSELIKYSGLKGPLTAKVE